MKHKLAKHKLRELINSLSFPIERCASCSWQKVIHFVDCEVRIEMQSIDGLWRYDCLVYDSDGVAFYALEVANTHFTGMEKAELTRRDGLGIAEFLAEDVLSLIAGNTLLNNLMCITKLCTACERKTIRLWEIQSEEDAWKQFDMDIISEWNRIESVEMAKLENEARNRREIQRACLSDIQQEITKWIELEQIMYIGLNGWFQYLQFEKQARSITTPLDKSKFLIEYYQKSIELHLPRWGGLYLDLKGLLRPSSLCGFILDISDIEDIPASSMFLMLIPDDNWESNFASRIRAELKAIWDQHSICNNLIFAVRNSVLIYKLQDLREGLSITLTSCLFPILKEVEQQHNLCANCGKYGHTSETCQQRFCSRCGRCGHSYKECFAKRTAVGRLL